MTQALTLTINGKAARIEVDDPAMPLLYALRNQLGFKSMHFGCGLAQCGACTVHVAGKPVRSCVFPVASAAGADILTLDGIGNAAKPHPLQLAFIEEQAAQCTPSPSHSLALTIYLFSALSGTDKVALYYYSYKNSVSKTSIPKPTCKLMLTPCP